VGRNATSGRLLLSAAGALQVSAVFFCNIAIAFSGASRPVFVSESESASGTIALTRFDPSDRIVLSLLLTDDPPSVQAAVP
jgi:hypothetical protein